MTRRALVGGCLVALEAVWLGTWLRWIAAATSPGVRPPGTLAVLAIGAAAFFLGRALIATGAPLGILRVVAVGAVFGATVLVARATLYVGYAPLDLSWLGRFGVEALAAFGGLTSAGLVVATTAAMWWRGTRAAWRAPSSAEARRAAAAATGALAALAVVVQLTWPVDLGAPILAAFALALVALALARLEDASAAHGGTASPLGATWAGLVGAAVLASVGLAFGLSAVLSLEAARALARSLAPLPEVVYRLVVLGVVTVVELVATAVFWLIARAYALFEGAFGVPDREVPRLLGFFQVLEQTERAGAGNPAWLVAAVRAGLAALVVVGLALWLGRALRRRYDRPGGELAGERTSDLSAGRLAADLAAAWRAVGAGVRARLAGWARPPGVRGLYADLLGLMADGGLGRPPSWTPAEYRATVAGALPAVAAEVGALTEAYNRARYGGREPSPAGLGALRAGAARIRRAAEGGAGRDVHESGRPRPPE